MEEFNPTGQVQIFPEAVFPTLFHPDVLHILRKMFNTGIVTLFLFGSDGGGMAEAITILRSLFATGVIYRWIQGRAMMFGSRQ